MLFIKINVLVLCGEVITVCSENNTEHLNALCRLNVEIVNDKSSGKSGNHQALKA